MLLSTRGTAECFWCPTSMHTHKQTHRCWFQSGTGPHGVGYHLGPQSPLQGKHQWLSLIPHSRSVLKGPWTDGEMGETLHISGHGQQPQVPSHHTHTIPLNMEHKNKGDGIGSKRRGRWGDSTPSLWRAELMRKPTQTQHTHIADKQVRGKKVFKWSFAFTVLNKLLNHCAGGMLHCASVPRKQVWHAHLNPENRSERLIIWW